jgi:hypothetical protein
MPAIASTSGRVHSEFVRLLFLQAHRETDRFFAASDSLRNLPVPSSTTAARRSPPSLSPRLENILAKAAALRITLNIDGVRWRTFSVTISHSPITLANLSSINLVPILRGSSPPRNPVYARRVDPSALAFSLSSHRHSYISLLFSSRFLT